MLDVDSIVPFLLERGLMDPGWIIDSELTIRAVPRRNRNLRVEGPAGVGFLIKQPEESADGGAETLRREAAFHRFCRAEPAAAAVTHVLPRLVPGRDEELVLVFELISEASSLQAEFEAVAGPGPAIAAVGALGRALGIVHRVFRRMDPDGDPRLEWLPRGLPSVMTLHKPSPQILAGLSRANCELLRILQGESALGEGLDWACRQWCPTTVIHGDIRLDNVLVRPGGARDRADGVALWITDWELVGIGDPAWDLAGALQDLLVCWVASMPLSDELTAEAMIARARILVEAVRAASRALWSGYCPAAGLDAVAAGGLLERAVVYSAARLIQSAYEHAAAAAQLPGRSVVLLQISANLIAEPQQGRVELYGIPEECPVP
jgi:hypothetical protein